MTDFIETSLALIRDGGIQMSWIDERRAEWSPLLYSKLQLLLGGHTFILICDEEREWFESYFMQNINKPGNTRPFLPFISLKSLYPSLNNLNSADEISLLDDMLSIAFPNGYIYFYIGKASSKFAKIAKNKDDSYLWLFDEQNLNSFSLKSSDKMLDFKLISMFKLLDKTIEAVLFGKVNIS